MKLISIFAIALLSSNLYSQNDWTKTDRNDLYEDFASTLSNYPSITFEQKESIGLCALEAITKRYSKSDYSSKIDVELKRIKESAIDQCAKNTGMQSISEPKKSPAPVAQPQNEYITKQILAGTWKTDHDMTLTFNTDGTYIKVYNTNFIVANRYTKIEYSTVKGEWFLDSKGEITLVDKWTEIESKFLRKVRRSYSESAKYVFLNHSDDFFKMSLSSGVNCCQVNGQGPRPKVIQGNRIN